MNSEYQTPHPDPQTWYWEKKWLFLIGNGAEIRPLEMGRKGPASYPSIHRP